jgi:catechol 2,3-dioxygenase-like lactoylglutathione lyase family enzyme
MSQQIAAISLLVPDYDAGIAFYVGTLGFTLQTDIDQGDGKRWVTVAPPGSGTALGGGTSLLLARAVGKDQQAAIGYQTGGRVGFFLATDDFARDHAAMLAAGVNFEESPRQEPYGTVSVWRDPFGNRWDLIQYQA